MRTRRNYGLLVEFKKKPSGHDGTTILCRLKIKNQKKLQRDEATRMSEIITFRFFGSPRLCEQFAEGSIMDGFAHIGMKVADF